MSASPRPETHEEQTQQNQFFVPVASSSNSFRQTRMYTAEEISALLNVLSLHRIAPIEPLPSVALDVGRLQLVGSQTLHGNRWCAERTREVRFGVAFCLCKNTKQYNMDFSDGNLPTVTSQLLDQSRNLHRLRTRGKVSL